MWISFAAIAFYLAATGLLVRAVAQDKVAASRSWLWPALGVTWAIATYLVGSAIASRLGAPRLETRPPAPDPEPGQA